MSEAFLYVFFVQLSLSLKLGDGSPYGPQGAGIHPGLLEKLKAPNSHFVDPPALLSNIITGDGSPYGPKGPGGLRPGALYGS